MCRYVVTEVQPFHRVAGHDEALKIQQSSKPALSSETSLQLKPEKQGHQSPLQTPSRTEGSDQTSPDRIPDDAGSMVESSQQGITVVPHTCHQNDLDKAIEQARVTKDLVSVGK